MISLDAEQAGVVGWRGRQTMSNPAAEQVVYTAILVGQPSDRLAAVSQGLAASGCEVTTVQDGAAALRAARKKSPDLVLATHELADSSGLKVIQSIKKRFPKTLGAVIGPRASAGEKRAILSEGADAYLELENANQDETELSISRLVARKQTGIIGSDEKMLQIIETIESIAPTKVTVLISGESGTGKELIARAIHARSGRKDKPFIAVNCGALPQGVLESEIFGHEKGSFTGAIAQRKGRFEISDGGTLLLDEVGEMPLGTQVKLLRVLEEERFMRVGGSQDVKVDVRVLAATNKDLWQSVLDGEFRNDLYYRLNVVPIHVPPLRDRKDDIPPIFRAIAVDACARHGIEFNDISEAALAALKEYRWPGNVRELRNLAESLIVLSGGKRIEAADLPEQVVAGSRELPALDARSRDQKERDLFVWMLSQIERNLSEEIRRTRTELGQRIDAIAGPARGDADGKQPVIVPGGVTYGEVSDQSAEVVVKPGASLREVERDLIEKTLREVKGNRKKAAKMLGMGERTLYRRMKQYHLR
jgi:DNA-binding NtrC family response regulator